mmetsp:Transcript_67480/g.133811  ORF Transcript_67480/g.133811 Transcript_67480/m.133811 type:complete len:523 (-) Transcript_67480:14-1582(-)
MEEDKFRHEGRVLSLQDLTLDNVGSMLRAQNMPTELRLGCVHTALFRSSAPPGQELTISPLIDWEEVQYCQHRRQHWNPNVSAGCGCKLTTLPPPTAEVVRAFIKIMDAVVGACHAKLLDWSIPPSEGEQNRPVHNTTMIGELLAEFQHSWAVIIKRVPGATGPHGVPGPIPSWWSGEAGGHAQALRANQAWRTTLAGSGARGERPISGSDDSVFSQTAWLLQYDRLLEFQARVAGPGYEGPQEMHFDDEGVLQLVPRGVHAGAEPAIPVGTVASSSYSAQVAAAEAEAALATVVAAAQNARETTSSATFALLQGVIIRGLNGRSELNGLVGEVLGIVSVGRYPVKVLSSGECVRVKAANLERTDAHPLEGKVIDGRCMRFGEWFNIQDILDASINGGKAAGDAFVSLEARDQADILAGRQALGSPIEPGLPEGCPRRELLGSGGGACDGCGQTEAQFRRLNGYEDGDEGEPFDVCERCQYTACADCRCHHSRGTCYCKDSNFDFTYPVRQEDREWYHRGEW